MYLGEPETAPRLDNVHRFMAGVYFGSGLIALWAALTIRQQKTLVFLIALSVFLAGTGRLVSISKVGLAISMVRKTADVVAFDVGRGRATNSPKTSRVVVLPHCFSGEVIAKRGECAKHSKAWV